MATTLREIAGANRVVLEIGSIPTAARLPDGGDEDQVLSKRSSRSLDVHWTPPVRLDVSSATVQQAISDLASRYSVSDIQGLTLDQRIIRFSWTDGNNRPRSTQIVVPAAVIDDNSLLPSQLKAETEPEKEAYRRRLEVPSDARIQRDEDRLDADEAELVRLDVALRALVVRERQDVERLAGLIGTQVQRESQTRAADDTALGTRIDTEITDRTEADTGLGASIGLVSSRLDTESQSRTNAINGVMQTLTGLGTSLTSLTGRVGANETAITGKADTTALTTETNARTAADTALGTRIDGIRQYPQSAANQLATLDVRDINGIARSGNTVTLSWTDGSGTTQTSQYQLPATSDQVAASLSLTPVANQAALDGLSTTGIAMAVTTVAFGSYSAQDFLVYDHGQSQWEKVGTFGTTLSDDSIQPGWLVADSATEKTAMRTRIAAASASDVTSLGTRVTSAETNIAGKANVSTVTGIDGRLTTAETKLAGVAAGAEVNVNADWNSTSGDSQILNKPSIPGNTEIDARIQLPARTSNTSRWPKNKLPSDTAYGTIPAAQVPSDWNAATGVARILNKPTLVTAWTGLSDTPSALTGQGGKHVAVNTGATALEFVDAPAGGGSGVDYIRVEGLSVSSGNAQLDLTWTANANASSYETRHKLTSATTWSEWTDRGNVTSYSITGLTNGSQYDVEVRGVEITIASAMGTPLASERLAISVSSFLYNELSGGRFRSLNGFTFASTPVIPQSWFQETLSERQRTITNTYITAAADRSPAIGRLQVNFDIGASRRLATGKTIDFEVTPNGGTTYTFDTGFSDSDTFRGAMETENMAAWYADCLALVDARSSVPFSFVLVFKNA